MQKVADALPGFGIVAAVLGIVNTMATLEGADTATIGHKVGAALVGTFLGILVAYGFVGPIAAAMEHRAQRGSQGLRGREDGARRQRARLCAAGGDRVRAQAAVQRRASDLRRPRSAPEGQSQSAPRPEDAAEPHGMQRKNERPIIIVKRKKKGGHGHHGGAWKVAYADFVTAMMAFFLVMWLVTAVSKEQRAAIFDYFKNPSMEPGKSVKPAPGQMGPGGASTSPINLGGGLDAMRPAITKRKDIGGTAALSCRAMTRTQDGSSSIKSTEHRRRPKKQPPAASEAEHKKLESLMEELRQAIDKSQALEPFKDQLLLDITPEGLRIQIVDAQNRPMFDVGSAQLRDYTDRHPARARALPEFGAQSHQPHRAYRHPALSERNGYTNWELSADRANAARRALDSGRAARRQDRARGRPVILGAVRQGRSAEPHQPAHQHHRDDQAGGRGGAEDRRGGRNACHYPSNRAGDIRSTGAGIVSRDNAGRFTQRNPNRCGSARRRRRARKGPG